MNEIITFANQLEIGNAQTIGYTYVPSIPGYGSRLYLQRGYGVATGLITALNKLSNWGGIDKDGENFVSWEFPKYIDEEFLGNVIREFL